MHRGPGRALGAGVAIALILGALAATPVAAASPTIYMLTIGEECVRVSGGPAETVTVRQLSSTNEVLGADDVTFNGSGAGSACFHTLFMPGMKIQTVAPGANRTFTVPNLSIRIDRATDVVKGVAPKSASLTLTVRHWTSFSAYQDKDLAVKATASGTYSKDTTASIAISGGDETWLAWHNTGGDFVRTYEMAPQVGVWIGRARMAANLLSGTGGSVTLKTPAGKTRARAAVQYNGSSGILWDYGTFRSGSGALVSPRVGDKVSSTIQSNLSFTIPNLTASLSASSNVVHGACPAHRPLQFSLGGVAKTVFIGAALCSAAGTYSYDFTPHKDVVLGQRVDVAVKLPTGDVVFRRTVAGS